MTVSRSIGRYLLEDLTSCGGMGEVWQARDEMLGRPVAVKLLYSKADDVQSRARFLREARTAARLVHPNVVATYDAGYWEGRPYLVMELLDGPSVAAELKQRGPLPISEIRRIGAQTATALAWAHHARVIHRDVKPGNLVWTNDGTLKLVDFGLAWLVDEPGQRLTPAQTAMGTTAYLAPEIAQGSTADEATDLYALGCTLYELACGRPPFQGTLPAMVLAHVNNEPTPPSTYRPDLPEDLQALILQLLSKDPARRPHSAEEVRRRLVTASEPVAVHRTPKRQMLAAAALVCGLLLISLVSWGLPGPNLGRLNSEPIQSTPTVTPPAPRPTEPSSTNPQSQPPQPIHDDRSDDASSTTTPSTRTLRGAGPEAGKEKAANGHGNGQGKKGHKSKKHNN